MMNALEHMLGATLSTAMALTHAKRGLIQFFEPKEGILTLAAHRGCSDAFLERFRVVRPGQGTVCGLAIQSHRRVAVDDVLIDPAFAPHLDAAIAEGFRAVQSTPLFRTNGAPIGVLSTYYDEPHTLSKIETESLDQIAQHLGPAIERHAHH